MLPKFNLTREQNIALHAAIGVNMAVEFHFHTHVELLAVLEGAIDVTINHRTKTLQPGQIAVALSYDAHQFRTPKSSRCISLVIPAELCPEFIAAVTDRTVSTPFLDNKALFDTLCSCYYGIKASENDLTVKGQLYLLLGTVLKHIHLEQKPESTDSRLLTELLIYLNTHYASEICLASIASDMGYNPSYLSRCFNASFHISIPAYLTMLRLRQAVLLMRDPSKSITDCAFESGFRSLRTFYRSFQEEFHCSPKQYQQENAKVNAK